MFTGLATLFWLEAKHLRAELNFWLWAAGADLDDANDVVERIYLVYLVVIAGAAIGACWLWLLGLVTGAAQAASPEAAALATDIAHMCVGSGLGFPACAAALWSVRAAWRAPWTPTPPDAAWLAQLPVSVAAWSTLELAKRAIVRLLAFGCTGYLIAAFADSLTGGAARIEACLPYATTLGLAGVAAYGLAWAVGLVRMRLGRVRRLPLALGAFAAGTFLIVLSTLALPRYQLAAGALREGGMAPVVFAACLALAALFLSFAMARILPPVTLMREGAADVSLYAVRRMAVFNPKAYRALLRSRRTPHGAPRIPMPRARGVLAVLVRSSVSLLRRYEALPGLIAAGAIVAPLGAWLLSGALAETSAELGMLGGATGGRVLGAASWILIALNSVDAPRALARVFIADERNRFVRDHLPVPTPALFAFDVLPAFAVAALFSAIVGACIGALGTPAGEAADFTVRALALDIALACIGALDAADRSSGRMRLTCESATALVAIAIAGAAALVPGGGAALAFLLGAIIATALAAVQLR